MEELREWWMQKAGQEARMVVDKAVEYSAVDLEVMGDALERWGGLKGADTGPESAIAFYVLGKVSRIIGALAEGREPDVDSWLDIGVYARMVQRIREKGSWPGGSVSEALTQEMEELPTHGGSD